MIKKMKGKKKIKVGARTKHKSIYSAKLGLFTTQGLIVLDIISGFLKNCLIVILWGNVYISS